MCSYIFKQNKNTYIYVYASDRAKPKIAILINSCRKEGFLEIPIIIAPKTIPFKMQDCKMLSCCALAKYPPTGHLTCLPDVFSGPIWSYQTKRVILDAFHLTWQLLHIS